MRTIGDSTEDAHEVRSDVPRTPHGGLEPSLGEGGPDTPRWEGSGGVAGTVEGDNRE